MRLVGQNTSPELAMENTNADEHPSAAQQPAVLLVGNYRPTLVLARAFKTQGYTVIAGLEGCDRGAEFSRYVDAVWDHPPIAAGAGRFLSALRRFLNAHPSVQTVFPVTEEAVRLFRAHREALPSGIHVPMMAFELVQACLDKRAMMERAVELKVPIAPFAEVRNLDQLRAEATKIGFPLVIRPLDSTRRLDGEKTITLADENALNARFNTWPADQNGLIIQKKAEGIRHNFYFAARNGRLERALHAIITRTDRKDGSGLAVDGITVDVDPDLERYTADLVASMGYSGIGCAQYLVDAETGAICFLEINPRIAGNHAVPERAGLDLGMYLFALDRYATPDTTDVMRGSAGLRYSWVAGDIEGLKASWRRGDLTSAEKLRWFGQLIGTARASNIDMMINTHDPLPGLVTLADTIPLVGKISRARSIWKWMMRPAISTDAPLLTAPPEGQTNAKRAA